MTKIENTNFRKNIEYELVKLERAIAKTRDDELIAELYWDLQNIMNATTRLERKITK